MTGSEVDGPELDGPALDDTAAGPYRLGPAGAVLVRPDGYVAWRAETAPRDPDTALSEAIDVALGRGRRRAASRAVGGGGRRSPVPALP